MRVIPPYQSKAFIDCNHGELLRLAIGYAHFWGICILSEESKRKVLIVSEDNSETNFNLVGFADGDEVLSVGSNWKLQLDSIKSKASDVFTDIGSILVSEEGTFMSCRGVDCIGFSDELLCRLDGPGILDLSERPRGGFAFGSWHIGLSLDESDESFEIACKTRIVE